MYRLLLTLGSLLFIIILSINNNTLAQGSLEIPPAKGIQSPTAASLARANDADISLYTGGVSYAVPIYNLGNYGIGFGYNSSGFKPAEIPGSTGLGWSLQGLGVITRSVRSLADETTDGYSNNDNTPNATHIININTGLKDAKPDIFHYNFAGYSGKFYFDNNGNIRVEDDTPLEVTIHDGSGSISKITIKDLLGNRYTFGINGAIEEVETKTTITTSGGSSNSGTQDKTYDSSWYLNSIEYVNGKRIDFTYQTNNTITSWIERRTGSEEVFGEFEGQITTLVVKDRYRNRITLDEISYEDTEIEFIHSSNRLDFSEENKLDSIIVKKNGLDIKSFALEYGYINTNERLILEEVHVLDNTFAKVEEWSFDYYNKDTNVPDIDTYQTDHWGFFNGESDNDTKPAYANKLSGYFLEVPENSQRYTYYDGINRSPNSGKAKVGLLKKVTYPTGGTATFEYEPNAFSEIGGVTGLKEVIEFDACANDQCATEVSTLGTTFYSDEFELDLQSGNTLPFKTTVQYSDLLEGTPPPNPAYQDICSIGSVYNNRYLVMKIVGVSDISYSKDLPINPFGGTCDMFGGTAPPSDGTYKIQITVPAGFPEIVSPSVKAYVEKNPTQITGPGHRIAKVTYSDGSSSTSNKITTYTYNKFNNINYSSGVLAKAIGYYDAYNVSISGAGLKLLKLRFTDNNHGISDQGPAMGYTNVQVNEITDSDTSYTRNYFTNSKAGAIGGSDGVTYFNDSTNTNVYPGAGWNSRGFARGRLLKKELYNSTDILIGKEITEYEHLTKSDPWTSYQSPFLSVNKDIPEVNIRSLGQINLIGKWGGSIFNYTLSTYSITHRLPIWSYPTKKKLFIYDSTTGDSILTSTEMTYGDTIGKQLTEMEKVNSDGSKRITKYRYAHQKYSAMQDSNMLVQLYSTSLENGTGDVLSKNWLEWTNSSSISPGSIWRMWKQSVWDGLGAYVPDDPTSNTVLVQQINKYDSYGNPIEIEDADEGVTKVYYGSNSSPFQNATTSGNAVNGVLGAYVTGFQKVLGTDNCASNCGTRPGSGDDLFTDAEYDDLGRITKITNENEELTTFGYDSFSRLIRTTNPEGATVRSSYFYSTAFDGTFDATAPNYVETITGIEGFDTDFSSSTGWSKTGDYTFNYDLNGETTLRLGITSSGGWSYVYRSPGEKNITAKTDFYPSSSYTSTVNPYPLGLNDGSSGTPNRCAIRYNPSTDKLYVYRRKNNDSWATGITFTLNAVPNKWYTLEIEKRDDVCMYWVYERGKSRSSGEYYQETGYPIDWTPQVRSWSKDDYLYLANLEFTANAQTSISYLDGLGREIQTQVRGGDKVIATETLYNERGLPEVTARPIETTAIAFPGFYDDGVLSGGSTFIVGDTLPAASPVHAYYAPVVNQANDEDYAYSQTQYEESPLARVEKSTLPGTAFKMGSGKEVETTYGLNTTESFTINGKSWGLNSLSKTVSKDPEGNETITYTDGWGQTIVSGVNMNPTGDDVLDKSTSDLVTYFEYDERGNLVRVEDPRGLATTYSYNTLGQLESKKLPDQTLSHTYKYDDKGRLRFHMDPNLDATSNYYYYTKYDELDRVTETGRRNSANEFSDEPSINDQSFPSSTHTPYVYYYYDGDNPLSGHTPNHTKGRLTKVLYKDPNSSYSGATFYSYNSLGLVEWVIQQPAQPTSSNNRKIEYSYDELGRMTRMYFNPLSSSSDDHYFWYYYDELGRLEKVTSYGSNAESSALTEAEYTYYADGQVERLILGDGAQTVDYDYTIQGWLDDINDGTTSGGDAFGMVLDYTDNGNIEQQQWKQAAAASTNTLTYNYGYDTANRLTSSGFDDPSGTLDNSNGFDGSFTYDDNGNITKIDRNAGTTGYPYKAIPSMSYSSTSNRITGFTYQDGPTSPVSKSVGYDANGNITTNTQQGITATTYDWRNLPTSLSANGSTLTYLYEGDGNRVKKQVGSTATWYVRGADGQTIAAYDASGNLLFINILAGGQIIGQIEN